MTSPILYILYNADASLMGKLSYGYKKITCSKDSTVCAACDITHGGLHLDETQAWKGAKVELTRDGVQIKQMHRDELSAEVKGFVEKEGLKYPMVLKGEGDGRMEVVMDREELNGCGGDAKAFVERLKKKGVAGASASSSL